MTSTPNPSADSNDSRVSQTDTTITVERTYDAPRELVWQALTSVEHLAAWWGPTGFTTTTERMDFREGGEWRYLMHGPDGTDYPNLIKYDEIREPEIIRFRHLDTDDTEPACHANTITLTENDGKTHLTMTLTFPNKDAKDLVVREYGAIDGGRQTLAHLAEHLLKLDSGEDDSDVLVIRRVLDAPVELVWEVWTTGEHLLEWFHPEVWHLSVCEMDLREGGSFFYCMSSDGMPNMYGLWDITTVRTPKQLEFVVSFSDADRGVVRAPFSETWPLRVMSTVTLEPHAGKGGGTVMTLRSWPIDANEAERETFKGGIGSMQQGWGQTLDSLAKHLAKISV